MIPKFTPVYIPISEIPNRERGYWKGILKVIPEGQALVLDKEEKDHTSAIRAVIARTPEFSDYRFMQRQKKLYIFHEAKQLTSSQPKVEKEKEE